MKLRYVLVLIAGLSITAALADEVGGWRFDTIEAKRAMRLYERRAEQQRAAHERELRALDAEHRAETARLQRDLLADLEAAKEKALVGQDLDEAVALNDAIEAIKRGDSVPGVRQEPGQAANAGPPDRDAEDEDPIEALTRRLTNTTWLLVEKEHKDGWVTFRPDNVLRVNFHRNGGMWAVVDSRTVRFTPWAGGRSIVEWRVDGQGRLVSVKEGVVVRQWR